MQKGERKMIWYRFDWEDEPTESFVLGIDASADKVSRELNAYKKEQPQRDYCYEDWAEWLETRGLEVQRINFEDTFLFPS